LVDAIKKYGRNWEKVAKAVGTRTVWGVRQRFQKMTNKTEIFSPEIAIAQP